MIVNMSMCPYTTEHHGSIISGKEKKMNGQNNL